MTPLSPTKAPLGLNTSRLPIDERDVRDVQQNNDEHNPMKMSSNHNILDDRADITPNGSEIGTNDKASGMFHSPPWVDEN